MNKGFTLIELLVVVLIIGILASVALPQYTKAVEKSRAGQVLSLLKSAYEASETQYMASGQWPGSFDEIPIDLPWTGTEKWRTEGGVVDTRSNEDWSMQLYRNGSSGTNGILVGRLRGKYAGGGFAIYTYFGSSSAVPVGALLCAEVASQGHVLTGTEGDYCTKLFKAKKIYGSGNIRFYLMP